MMAAATHLEPPAPSDRLTALLASHRLRALARRVLHDVPMADVGTDHARLPCALIATGVVPRAIATDRAAGPLKAAAKTAAELGVEVELRCADGLETLRNEEIGSIVLAGMGARRISALLDRAPDVAAGAQRLILQPNDHWPQFRAWLGGKPWTLEHEDIVEDGGKFYVIWSLAPQRAARHRLSPADLELGPLLRRNPTPTYGRWVRAQLRALARAYEHARMHADPDNPTVQRLHERLCMYAAALPA